MTALNPVNLLAWTAQTAALAVAALVLLRAVRLDAPAVRYPILRAVLLACLLLPLLQPYQTRSGAGTGTGVTTAQIGQVDVPGPSPSPVPAAAASWGAWPWWIALVLLGGATIRLGSLAVGLVRLQRLRRAGERAPWCADQEELGRIIGVHATIRYVAGLGQPATLGWRRPVVLLPDSLRRHPPGIQRAVLAHELWHVRRRDWLWTVWEEALRAVLWFHPAVWALISSIQQAREEVVDELAVLATGSRRSYLDALLAFADAPPTPAATAFARRRHLVRRTVLITKEAVMSARRVVVCCAAVAVALVATGWYAVWAFPLVQDPGSTLTLAGEAGELERRARPVTPENPVPRRIYSIPAQHPSEAADIGARADVHVRLTIDDAGRVAEARVLGFTFSLASEGRPRFIRGSVGEVERALSRQYPGASSAELDARRAALVAMVREATAAASAWAYAPPAEGPLSFEVTVPVGAPPPPPAPPSPAAAGAPGQAAPPPPPPPPDGSGLAEGALRVGGTIKTPTKIRNVSPVYPPVALAAGVQGVVIIEARIEGDGKVSGARVLRSIPLLDAAALDAVRQWEFTPTLLNGLPVAVVMTTTVNFTLQ